MLLPHHIENRRNLNLKHIKKIKEVITAQIRNRRTKITANNTEMRSYGSILTDLKQKKKKEKEIEEKTIAVEKNKRVRIRRPATKQWLSEKRSGWVFLNRETLNWMDSWDGMKRTARIGIFELLKPGWNLRAIEANALFALISSYFLPFFDLFWLSKWRFYFSFLLNQFRWPWARGRRIFPLLNLMGLGVAH